MAVSGLVVGLLLAAAPASAQQGPPPPLPPAASTPTLYFSKDPNPVPPPPMPLPAAPPPSSVHLLPRALFPAKDTPQVSSSPPSLHFTKEAAGAAPAVVPPSLRFTKDAATGPALAPAPPAPALHFTKGPMPSTGRLPPGREVPPRAPSPVVVRVAMQQPAPPPTPVAEEDSPSIQLNPPGPQRVFRLESEDAWRTRMDQEARQRGQQRIEFPPEPVVSTQSYTGRNYPPLTEFVEPGYVCYRRLYFEERNAERYDWDLGFMQPLVSLGYFYKDFVLLPYHMFTDPCRKFECDAGYCLPGDPMPYLLYPPALSLTGAIAEIGAVITVLVLLPG